MTSPCRRPAQSRRDRSLTVAALTARHALNTHPAGRRCHRKKLRIVVTAGPTREYFDSVRFISNASSGKMGYAIAKAAAAAGHEVTLVSGPVALKPPAGVKTFQVTSATEMAAAAKRAFVSADAAIFVAAVCDYRPRVRHRLKQPKRGRRMTVKFEPTEDIAASLGKIKGRRITVCFALEDHDGRAHAEAKLRRKNCDAIVLNGPESVGSGLAGVEFLVRGGRWEGWRSSSKSAVAGRLVHVLEALKARRSRRPG